MDILKKANKWLESIRHDKLSDTVVYIHNSIVLPNLQATLGKSEYEEIKSDGSILSVISYDFIFRTSDFNFIPQEGDKIIHDNCTYIVKSQANRKCYSVDNYKTSYRINTALMKDNNNG